MKRSFLIYSLPIKESEFEKNRLTCASNRMSGLRPPPFKRVVKRTPHCGAFLKEKNMKKKLLIVFISIFLIIPIFSQSINSYFADYELGNDYFDRKDYNRAIKQYLSFWKNYTSNINTFEKNNDISKDNNGIVKESYFSLYNIACSYSLLQEFDEAEYYLKYAILAGYPYLDHILKDSDLSNLFSVKKELKSDIQNLYNKGNSKELLIDKRIYLDNLDGTCYCFFKDKKGTFKFTKYGSTYLDISKREIYGEGEFEFKNFKIILKYNTYKEIYQDYENNLRTENKKNHDPEFIYWYTIGTDASASTYYIKDDWKDSYKKNKELLIPVN